MTTKLLTQGGINLFTQDRRALLLQGDPPPAGNFDTGDPLYTDLLAFLYNGKEWVSDTTLTAFGTPLATTSDLSTHNAAYSANGGTNGHIYGSDELIAGYAEWTLSAYVKCPASGVGHVGRWDGNSSFQSYVLEFGPSGFNFYIYDGDYQSIFGLGSFGGSFSSGEWARVVVTMASDNTVTLLKNGVSVGSATLPDPFNVARGINTPTDIDTSSSAQANDVELWGRKLTGTEITNINGEGVFSFANF